MSEVVCLELYAVQFIQSAQFANLFLSLLARHGVLSVLVGSELFEQVLCGKALAPLFFRAKLLRYGEERHDGVGVQIVCFHLIQYLCRIGKCLRQVGEYFTHLLAGLEPLLLGVQHACGVVQVLVC